MRDIDVVDGLQTMAKLWVCATQGIQVVPKLARLGIHSSQEIYLEADIEVPPVNTQSIKQFGIPS